MSRPSGRAADLLRSGAWRDFEPPDRVFQVPTMLDPDESRLLYALARDGWERRGRIVDAGCFLGGSTVALAQGIRDSSLPGPPVDVYDQFLVEQYTLDDSWFDGHALDLGDSFRSLFDANVSDLLDLLEIHQGDIVAERFDHPIEILFLDVLKAWDLADAVTAASFRQLVPGAIVIHQDWWSASLPWITLTMERLERYFEHLVDAGESRVFALTSPIPAEDLDVSRLDLEPNEMVATFQAMVDALDGPQRGLQMLNMAQLLLMEVSVPDGLAMIEKVEREHGGDPMVRDAVTRVHRWLVPEDAEAGLRHHLEVREADRERRRLEQARRRRWSDRLRRRRR